MFISLHGVKVTEKYKVINVKTGPAVQFTEDKKDIEIIESCLQATVENEKEVLTCIFQNESSFKYIPGDEIKITWRYLPDRVDIEKIEKIEL